MPLPQRPSDLYVVNGWYLEMPGLQSPHFETLEGLSRKSGTVDIVDAGSNIKFKFTDQILDFMGFSITRTLDGSSDDTTMRLLVEQSIRNGTKYVGAFVKLHHLSEVFRIMFEGLRFVEENHPTQNINAGEKYLISYVATVDTWFVV